MTACDAGIKSPSVSGNIMTLVLAWAALWFASATSLGSAQKIALENTAWTLTIVSGRALDASNRTVQLKLDSTQKRAYGFAGCNNFSGRYGLSRSALTFSDVASTRKGCIDPALAKVEYAYLAALSRVRSWRIRGTTLTLRNAAGRSLLTFEQSAEPENPTSPKQKKTAI